MIDFWYRTSRVDISFWSLTIQMLSLHQRTPYLMQHAYFPLPKYEERKKKTKICVFPSLFETKTGAHNTSSTNKTHLLQTSNRRKNAQESTQRGWRQEQSHAASESREGLSYWHPQSIISGVWSTSSNIHAQLGGRGASWDHLCGMILSSVRGSVVFKPTFPTLESWGLTHILLMN